MRRRIWVAPRKLQLGILTVFIDTAIRGKDLDAAKGTEAKRRAEEALRDKSQPFPVTALAKKSSPPANR